MATVSLVEGAVERDEALMVFAPECLRCFDLRHDDPIFGQHICLRSQPAMRISPVAVFIVMQPVAAQSGCSAAYRALLSDQNDSFPIFSTLEVDQIARATYRSRSSQCGRPSYPLSTRRWRRQSPGSFMVFTPCEPVSVVRVYARRTPTVTSDRILIPAAGRRLLPCTGQPLSC